MDDKPGSVVLVDLKVIGLLEGFIVSLKVEQWLLSMSDKEE
jgi:hypothetical protein